MSFDHTSGYSGINNNGIDMVESDINIADYLADDIAPGPGSYPQNITCPGAPWTHQFRRGVQAAT